MKNKTAMNDVAKSNIIQFPKPHSDNLTNIPTEPVQAYQQLEQFKEEFNADATEFVYEQVVGMLNNMGFFTTKNKDRYDENDFMLIYESIRSAMNRYQRVYHPFHEMVGEIFGEGETVESED